MMQEQREQCGLKAMVLAAGRGTRLRPLTDTRPKALVEVGGITLLEHVLGRLACAGVTEAVINLHHHGAQIPAFLESHGRSGLRRIAFSDEEALLLDTGGGLRNAAWFFDDGRPFLVHNVDVLSDIDLRGLMAAHEASGALVTLAVMARPTSRPLLFDAAGRLAGRRKDGSDQIVRRPEGEAAPLGFCGIYAASPALFAKITETGAFPLVDCLLRLVSAGEPVLAHRVDGARWRDCGRLEDLRPL